MSLHQLTSLTGSQKAVEVHSCQPWVSPLSIVPHSLGILTANITYWIILLDYVNECQVNVHVV